MNAPQQIHTKGDHGGYETIVLEVHICRAKKGGIWSLNDFQALEDAQIARKWPTGGAGEIAQALFTEAVRREAFLSSLVKMTENPQFLAGFREADEEGKKAAVKELVTALRFVFTQSLDKMGEDCVREVLSMMAGQLPPTKDS